MALIDKDQVKAEIKRQIHIERLSIESQGDYGQSCHIVAYENILPLLDTPPESAKRGYKDCNGCEYNRTIKDQIGWQFRGCFGGEYKGKPIAEIELCPLKVDTLPEQPVEKLHTQSGIPPLDYYQGIIAGRSDVIDHPEQYDLQKSIKLDEKDMEMYQEVMTAIIFAKNRLKELGCEGLSERMTSAFEWLKTKFKSK